MGKRECEKWVMRSNKRVIVGLVFKTSYKFDVTLYYFCHINVMVLLGAHKEREKARVEPVFLFICEKSPFFELNVDNGLDNVLYVYEVCCCIESTKWLASTNNIVFTATKKKRSSHTQNFLIAPHRPVIFHFLVFGIRRIKTRKMKTLSATFTFMFSRCINQIAKVKNRVSHAPPPFTANTFLNGT